MDETKPEKPTLRFLSFADDKEDAEKAAKLKDAAARIEQAMVKERNLSELVDYKEYSSEEPQVDPTKDTRSLYERLREQRDKKKEDLEESQKLSNLITKLDEDDVDYLNEVAKNKREEELRKRLAIQDALEAKRILDEQKMIEQERKMKESLLGKVSSNITSSTLLKSSKAKLIMSSKIKVKPKSKDQNDVTSATTMKSTQDDGSSKEEQPTSDSAVTSQSGNHITRDTSAITTDQPNNPKSDRTALIDDTGNHQSPESTTQDCRCQRDVMTSIGVLASLPIVKQFRDSSDESEDNSDDDLERRLVPRSFKRRK